MNIERFAKYLGIFLAVFGLMGLVPALIGAPLDTDPILLVSVMQGRLLNIFPVNIIRTLLLLFFGIWGMIASSSLDTSVLFSRVSAWVFAIMAIIGIIPGLEIVFGVAPLYGHNIWLNALVAVFAAAYGYGDLKQTTSSRTI